MVLTLYSSITRELPGNHPYAVKQNYARLFTEHWNEPVQDFFTKAEGQFRAQLMSLADRHFAAFSAGGLHETIT
jgi:hypothetical protein